MDGYYQNATQNGGAAANPTITDQTNTFKSTNPTPAGAAPTPAPAIPANDLYAAPQGQNNLTQTFIAGLDPQLQVPDDTLSATPWYEDTAGLVTGNPNIRRSVQPVKFTVYLDRHDPSKFLHNPADNSPIEIQLNTSLQTFELTSRHIYNRTPSRTGMHITLWGMQPDLITGSGTTGVFMNQFGLTDFFSVADINEDIVQLLTSGITQSFRPTAVQSPQTSTGTVFLNSASGDTTLASSIYKQQVGLAGNTSEAFRVAAQDCFVELLKLFQMNGSVWYRTPNYQGSLTEQEQVSPSAWSSKTGASTFQQHSRNNDVMTRGYVSMRYRNNVYLGYFKSLSWTQDAASPFQWKFNFVFQVEKTYTALYNPNFSVTQRAPVLTATAALSENSVSESPATEQVTHTITDINGQPLPGQ